MLGKSLSVKCCCFDWMVQFWTITEIDLIFLFSIGVYIALPLTKKFASNIWIHDLLMEINLQEILIYLLFKQIMKLFSSLAFCWWYNIMLHRNIWFSPLWPFTVLVVDNHAISQQLTKQVLWIKILVRKIFKSSK